MTAPVRVAVFGGATLAQAVTALGHQIDDAGEVALIEVGDEDALTRAASLDQRVPRILVADAAHRPLLRAAGADPALTVDRTDAAMLGPLIATLRPRAVRSATRVLVVAGTCGGIGVTQLCTGIATRLSRAQRVVLVDATGSGSAGRRLGVEGSSWADLEGLAAELSTDHIPVIARESSSGALMIGGGVGAPSDGLVSAIVRVARATCELLIVDAPPLYTSTTRSLLPLAERVLVVCTADSPNALDLAPEDAWLIASQTEIRRVAGRDVMARLPRDEARRAHAYDELAELISVDVTR